MPTPPIPPSRRCSCGPSSIRPGDAILATRNKRSQGEPDIHVAHLVTENAGQRRATQFETDRRAFIGRGRDLGDAAAFDRGQELSGSLGFTLDPIFSLRRAIRIPAGKKATITFWTLAAADRATLEDRLAHFRHTETFSHESRLAWTRSQVQLRHLNITSQDAETFQRLARYLIYPDMDLRIGEDAVREGLASQSTLWPLGISGDHPIFVLRTDDDNDLTIVREALAMQEYLRGRGLVFDLVILNERVTSYAQDLQQAVDILCENARNRGLSDAVRAHIFAVRRDLMDEVTYDALLAAARITLHTRNGRLSQQLARITDVEEIDPEVEVEEIILLPADVKKDEPPQRAPVPADVAKNGEDLLFWNGMGGFDGDTGGICRAADGHGANAAAVDQRHFRQGFRLPRLGRRRGIHLEHQFARLPTYALEQRSRAQQARRGALRARPRQRRHAHAFRGPRRRGFGAL